MLNMMIVLSNMVTFQFATLNYPRVILDLLVLWGVKPSTVEVINDKQYVKPTQASHCSAIVSTKYLTTTDEWSTAGIDSLLHCTTKQKSVAGSRFIDWYPAIINHPPTKWKMQTSFGGRNRCRENNGDGQKPTIAIPGGTSIHQL